MTLLGLSGCLPEDRLQSVRYSPDGRYIALINEREGLRIVDMKRGGVTSFPDVGIVGGRIAWSRDSKSFAYTTRANGPRDIAICDLHASFTLLTQSPARDEYPQFLPDGSVLFLTSESGMAQLASRHPAGTQTNEITTGAQEIIAPSLSPDGSKVAYFAMDKLRPQLWTLDLLTGHQDRITSESDPFSLVLSSPPAWNPKGDQLLLLRDTRTDQQAATDADTPAESDTERNPVGDLATRLTLLDLKSRNERILSDSRAPIGEAVFQRQAGVLFTRGGNLVRRSLANGGTEATMSFQKFRVSSVCPSPTGDRIAFAAENRLLATALADLSRPRFQILELADKFLLAEEYFRKGARAQTLDLYEELAASVDQAADPLQAQFVYIANLARLGRNREAVTSLEQMLSRRTFPPTVPEDAIWRLLGFAYLLELKDFTKAQFSFEQAKRIEAELNARSLRRQKALTVFTNIRALLTGRTLMPEPTAKVGKPDLTSSALEILRRGNKDLTAQFASAIKARLDADVAATIKHFGALIDKAPDMPAVRREYARALNGFDKEVYYFSPSQRPFRPTAAQRIAFFEQFLTKAPPSPESDEISLELFLLCIESRKFARARALLLDTIAMGGSQSLEGVAEAFEDFLERPETQPWLEAAMREVFLHPTVRPRLEANLEDDGTHFLMEVAATKIAVLEETPDRARAQADAALTLFEKLPADRRQGSFAHFRARLTTMRAREAQQRGLFAEAATLLEQAALDMEKSNTGEIELHEEIQFQAAVLRALITDAPDHLVRRREVEATVGDELVNPTWDNEKLRQSVRVALRDYDNAAAMAPRARTLLSSLAAYDAGVAFGKLRLPMRARAALLEAAAPGAPTFIQHKALIELAALDEQLDDPWNSARRWGQITDLPTATEFLKPFISFRIARAHLSIGFREAEARQALTILASRTTPAPLVIQARELLRTLDSP